MHDVINMQNNFGNSLFLFSRTNTHTTFIYKNHSNVNVNVEKCKAIKHQLMALFLSFRLYSVA